jgi:hypothetical protein
VLWVEDVDRMVVGREVNFRAGGAIYCNSGARVSVATVKMMSRGELEGDYLRRFGQKAVTGARGASERTEYAIRAINIIGATNLEQIVVGASGKDMER